MQFSDTKSVYHFDLCDIPLPKKDTTELYINLPDIERHTLQQKHLPSYLTFLQGPFTE